MRLVPSSRLLHELTIASITSFRQARCPRCLVATRQGRRFSSLPPLLAGHSKWDNIKHDKAKNDAVKGKQRVLLATELEFASKLGGPDPKMNPRLADAIVKAKKASLPKANIETAIARGQGLSTSGAKLEQMTDEALLPPGIAIIVEMLTENKFAAKVDVRKAFKACEATPSSISYLFEKKGRILFAAKDGVTEDAILDEAVNAGALDVEEGENGWAVLSTVADITKVTKHLKEQLGLEVEQSEIIWDPKERIPVEAEKTTVVLEDLIGKLKEIPSVKEVYTNAN